MAYRIETVKLRLPATDINDMKFLPMATLIEEGEPYYVDEYDHSKPLELKVADIKELTKLSMDKHYDLRGCLEDMDKVSKYHVRKKKKLIDQATNLKWDLWKYNADIRRIVRGIYIVGDDIVVSRIQKD
jgi:hypothetical protein